MKLIKTDHRSKLKTTTLDQLMTIQMGSPNIKDYSPDAAIEAWMGAVKTTRRSTFKDGRTPRSGRLEVERTTEDRAEPVPEEEMEVDQGGDVNEGDVDQGDDQEVGVQADDAEDEEEEQNVFFNDNMEDEDDNMEDEEGFGDLDNELVQDEVYRQLREITGV